MSVSFYKPFNSEKIHEGFESAYISEFGKTIGIQNLYMLQLRIHNPYQTFVVSPQYASSRTHKLLDFQASVTGTCLKGESHIVAAKREIVEECGIIISELQFVEQRRIQRQMYHNFICVVDDNATLFSNTKYSEYSDHIVGTDDRSMKVQILCLLPIQKLDMFLSASINVLESPDTTTHKLTKNSYISGVRLTKLDCIAQMMIDNSMATSKKFKDTLANALKTWK